MSLEEGGGRLASRHRQEEGPSLDQVRWMRRAMQACLPYRAFLFARTAPNWMEARVEITLML